MGLKAYHNPALRHILSTLRVFDIGAGAQKQADLISVHLFIYLYLDCESHLMMSIFTSIAVSLCMIIFGCTLHHSCSDSAHFWQLCLACKESIRWDDLQVQISTSSRFSLISWIYLSCGWTTWSFSQLFPWCQLLQMSHKLVHLKSAHSPLGSRVAPQVTAMVKAVQY